MGEIVAIRCGSCKNEQEYYIGGSGIGGDLTPLYRCLGCNFMETYEKEHWSASVEFCCPKCNEKMEEIDEDDAVKKIPEIKCFFCGELKLKCRNIGWWD